MHINHYDIMQNQFKAQSPLLFHNSEMILTAGNQKRVSEGTAYVVDPEQ